MTDDQPYVAPEASSPRDFETEPSHYPAQRRHKTRMILGALLTLGAACAMLVLGGVESAWVVGQPGAQTFMVLHPEAEWEDSRPVSVRRIPLDYAFQADAFIGLAYQLFASTQILELFGDRRTEMLVHVPLEEETLAAYLESGRLPEPGQPEVLAGDLARFDQFEVDGVTFEVVGRLKSSVSAALYGYLLPRSDTWEPFFDAADALPGIWFSELPEDTEALSRYVVELFAAEAGEAEEESGEAAEAGDEGEAETVEADSDAVLSLEAYLAQTPDNRPTVRGGMVRTLPIFSGCGLILLILSALGGALFMYHGLAMWYYRNPEHPFAALPRAVMTWRWVYVGMHVFLYGVLFAFMLGGHYFALHHYWITEQVALIFSEGDLEHVGSAYASGNILDATWATFYNNYIDQTLLLNYAISMAFIPLGVLKTAFSFALVGFVMTPSWAGQLLGFSYHSITMVLELQAYILACFAVFLWPVHLIRGFMHNSIEEDVKNGMTVLGHSALLVGVVLLFAAFYEAVTLILIGGSAL